MTNVWVIVIIALGLAMDCFAVALGIGASFASCTLRSVLRLSFHFGLFQGGMTLLGWLVGSTVVELIAGVDHWIAMLMLSWLGGRMIFKGLNTSSREPLEMEHNDPTRGISLLMLSIATSIDALGVGLSLALLKWDVVATSLLIGLVSLVLTVVGLLGGKHLNNRLGKRAEVLGGIVLVSIGLRIVITHLGV